MLRLLKYLKPYLLVILITIVLLFGQAYANLALPDYMSFIVNVGIQQGGVQNAVPIAIRQSEMDKLMLFLSPEDQSQVQEAYTLVDQSSPDYSEALAKYPALANQPIYVRNPLSQDQIDRLNPVMGKAFLAVSSIQQMMADPAKAQALAQSMGFDLSKLPAGADVFSMISGLPQAQRARIIQAIEQRFATMGPSMVNQSAVVAVKAEYQALGMDTGQIQTDYILHTGLIMLMISLLAGACTIAVGFLSARVGAAMARDVRKDLFERVESFSNVEFNRFSTASLITRSTNDITQVQMVVIMLMRIVFYAPIIGVGGVIMALAKSASMWWIIALAVIVLLGLVMVVFSIALPKFRLMQDLIDRLNLVTRENLSGMMVIRAFNMQGFEEQRFDRANADLTGTSLFVNRIMVTMFPIMMFIMNGLTLLIIWVGAHQVAASSMQVGDMIAFMQYAMQIVMAFLMMSMMFIIIPRASVSGGRIADVLETKPSIQDPQAPQAFRQPFRGQIEFRNVSFRYPDALEDVLHDITFTAQPGQTTAFIGSTGSGKSTVVNLIPRFFEVTSGAVLVNGTDIRRVRQSELRDKIGYIPQKGMLFSGTVKSNLRYADENATEDSLKEAADIAQASEFIFANPEGFKASISQAGANVSGGQKQRLSIARALVKKPPIFIFDDSFSALDFRTDAALRRALKTKTKSSTVLIVTQRVSTVKDADQIIVLEEGRIVGKGNHADLIRDCETYRQIALSQLSLEELS
jgi:ATP-binding cassette subfamily B multidrug efflux pump